MSPRNKGLPAFYRRRTDELVASCSPFNQATVASMVEQRRNEQQNDRSIYNWTLAVSRLDEVAGGGPLRDLPATTYTSTLAVYRETVPVPGTMRAATTAVSPMV